MPSGIAKAYGRKKAKMLIYVDKEQILLFLYQKINAKPWNYVIIVTIVLLEKRKEILWVQIGLFVLWW